MSWCFRSNSLSLLSLFSLSLGSHRRAHEKGPSTPGRNHEESPRKKLTTVQFSPRNHGKGEGRSKGTAGGRDSLQQSSRHENKHGSRARDTELHSNSRHGRPVHVLTEKPHSRRSHHHKHPSEGKGDVQARRGGGGGHRSHHGIRKPAVREEEGEGDVNPDSGISIEETSSPEVAPQLEGDTGCEEGPVETEEPLEGREDEVKATGEEEDPVLVADEEVCTAQDTVRRISYTRVCIPADQVDHC